MRESVKVNDKTYYVAKPSLKQENDAKVKANQKFREALDSGAYLREELNKKLIDRGIWSDQEETRTIELQKEIKDALDILDSGGIELSEAKKLALLIRERRGEFIRISQKLREHDAFTVEGQSDNTYFDALVSYCCYDEEGNKLFTSYEDYMEKSGEDYSIECARKLSSIMFGLSDNWQKELPENKFLLEYKFINEDMDFINKQGKRVDSEGRLINKDGRYINENEEFVNINGERVDESGNRIRERKPFLLDGIPVMTNTLSDNITVL